MEKQSRAIELSKLGKSQRAIAGELGVSKSSVNRWIQDATIQKSWLSPRWVEIGRGDNGPIDAYGAIPAPEVSDLLKLYVDTVYSCTDWLSNSVSSTELKVYVTTAPGQKAPRCATGPVRKSPALEHVPNAHLAHVLDGPLVQLLRQPNPEMSRKDFLKFLDMQLSLVGNCYVEIKREDDDLPCYLWPLRTQNVKWAVDQEKGVLVGYWYEEKIPPRFIPKENVIHFRLMNPSDPYGEGLGPVRALYERNLLGRQELAYLNSLFRNQARPDSIVTIKGATPDQLERSQKEWNMRNKQGAIGGVMFLDAEDMECKPLSWAPKDLLGTELYKWTKLQILNAFGLNPAIFDTESANRAVADTARYLAQVNAVLPRQTVIEECLNRRLVPDFDKRFVVAFDSPVQEDLDFDLKKRQTYLASKVYTINEVRKMDGLDPKPWGDIPDGAPQRPQETAEDKPTAQADAPITNDLRSTVGGLQAIAALQQAFYGGQLPREAAVANVVLLFGFKQAEAEALFPQIAPKPLTNQNVNSGSQNVNAGVVKCGGAGGTPGPCPEGGEDNKAAHVSGWADKAKAIPGKVYAKAKDKAQSYYGKLEGRYGKAMAISIMAAGVAGIPLPVPGSSFLTAAPVIAVAEIIRAFSSSKQKEAA